jgi:C4-dicarboxylate transporter, DctM subunit
MTTVAFAGLIVLTLLLRQNIILILAVAAAFVHVHFANNSSIEFLIQDIWFTIDREVLLSIPMFILAGAVMTRGAIALRLIRVMTVLTAPIPGGLAVAAVLSCASFAAISGSSIVTMLAIGSVMYPALVAGGYSRSFAVGVICSGGTLGIIIPPSIPMILFGIMTEVSVAKMFMGGIGPGLLLTLFFVIYSYWLHRRMVSTPWRLAEIGTAIWEGGFARMMPVILLGGIYSGIFTATESAVVALVYALLVELVIHRELKARDYFLTGLETAKLLGTLLPLIAIAGSLNTILDYEGVPKALVAAVTGSVTDPLVLLLGMNLLLLVVGSMMDIGSAILVLAPLLTPIAVTIGMDKVHFGVMMIANLEIGYLTPPVGLNLFVAMAAFKEPFSMIVRSVLPFIGIMLVWLVIVAFLPGLTLYFVK